MTIDSETRQRVVRAAQAASEKKAVNIVALDVGEHLALTDAFLICTGVNERQVDSIANAIEDSLPEGPVRREGKGTGRWVLLDFGDLIVHVFHQEEREFYGLERLWKDCPSVDVSAMVEESASLQPQALSGVE